MSTNETGLRRFANIMYPLYAPVVHRIFRSDLFSHIGAAPDMRWLGYPILQDPFGLWTLQEVISEVRPQLIVETGTYRGTSAMFYAQLLDLLAIRGGRVVTVDVQKHHALEHPRVTWLLGGSTSDHIVATVRAAAREASGAVMVVLDSDHRTAHVAAELACYHDLVTPGSYLHVQDGNRNHWGRALGPLRATIDFLRTHPEFEVDEERCRRFLITRHPMGWLRRRSFAATITTSSAAAL